MMTNVVTGSFNYKDIVLYLLNSIVVSLSSNGLNDFNKGKSKETSEKHENDIKEGE